jgi:hypothetical protein
MAWYLVKHRDNFTVTYLSMICQKCKFDMYQFRLALDIQTFVFIFLNMQWIMKLFHTRVTDMNEMNILLLVLNIHELFKWHKIGPNNSYMKQQQFHIPTQITWQHPSLAFQTDFMHEFPDFSVLHKLTVSHLMKMFSWHRRCEWQAFQWKHQW